MSGLITSGDTVNNFGKLLPAVYIERIYINDDDTDGAQLDVDLSIYVRAAENTDTTTIISQLENLKITWLWSDPLLMSGDDWSSMTTTEDGLEKLLNKEHTAWELALTTYDALSSGTVFKETFPLSDISEDYLIIYDDEGNKTLKFSYSSKTVPSTFTLSFDSWDELGSGYNVYLFAYATFDAFDSSYWSGYMEAAASDPTNAFDDRFGRFAAIETGDVAWESVWIDGEPSHPEQVIWVDGDGNAYDGTPLQSLASKYYSTDVITHSEIVSSFEDLLGNYETAAESDDSLRDIMDQISLVLATHKESAGLLAQLNLIARVFPSKSSVTNVGALYIQYREKITTANAVIETGTEVFKEVITNTKVVDERGTAISYEEPGTTLYGDETFDTSGEFISNMKMSRLVSVEQAHNYVSDVWEWDDVDYTNYGFVFFDYDKALYETADMGYYLHMDSLINLLGKTTFNAYFKIYKARFYRYYDYEGDDQYQIMSLATSYGSGYKPSGTVHFNRAKSNGRSRDASQPYIQAKYDNSDDSCAVHSFLMLRNLESLGVDPGTGVTLGTMASEEHRLMCFEFQDLYTPELDSQAGRSDVVDSVNLYDDTTMWFEVQMLDYTAHFVYYLIKAYKDLYDGGAFEDYYDEATTSSNYNSEDDMWTSEYVNTLLATYEDDPGSAPWVLYPVYYCVFEDLASKKYDSDLDTVMAAATKISARIHPTYGTVSDLKSFFEKFEALYDDILAAILADTEDSDGAYTTKKYQDTFALEDLLAGVIIPVEPAETDDGYEITSICDTAAYAAEFDPDAVEVFSSAYPLADTSFGFTETLTTYGDEVGLNKYYEYDPPSSPGWFMAFSYADLYIDGEAIEDGADVSEYFTISSEAPCWDGDLVKFKASVGASYLIVYLDIDEVLTNDAEWDEYGADGAGTYVTKYGLGCAASSLEEESDGGETVIVESNFDGAWSIDELGDFKAADFSYSFVIYDDD